jgi:hypothetical protein
MWRGECRSAGPLDLAFGQYGRLHPLLGPAQGEGRGGDRVGPETTGDLGERGGQ